MVHRNTNMYTYMYMHIYLYMCMYVRTLHTRAKCSQGPVDGPAGELCPSGGGPADLHPPPLLLHPLHLLCQEEERKAVREWSE